jgi:hypothetical protein
VTDRQQQLLDFYRRYRLSDQLGYYRARTSEYEAAELQASWVAGGILVLAAANAFVAASGVGPWPDLWRVLAAVLPALAVSVTAYQRIYAFDRLAKLYQDAVAALRVPLAMPVTGDEAAAEVSIQALVTKTEEVFAKEQGQWGQLVEELQAPQPPKPAAPKGRKRF